MEASCINKNATLLDALKVLNSIVGNDALTLFVLDDDRKVVGTLTDGDIRRSIISGKKLENKISEIAFGKFSYLQAGNFDIKKLHECRAKGIELLPILDSTMHLVDSVNLKTSKSYLPIDAVLMAGGKGERLRPLTEKTPKPLLQMDGKPIIDYIIEHIISYGIKNISVTVNYLKEQLEEHFTNPFIGIQVNTVREPKFLGTIGSLKLVKEFQNDTVLLMNSDAITDINLEDFYLHYQEHNADISVAAIPYTISVPYGILDLDDCVIKGVLEKPIYDYYANTGIYLIKRELLELIPDGEYFNATDFMELLVAKGYKVTRFPLNGTWIDIGNPQEYQKAKELVKHIKF